MLLKSKKSFLVSVSSSDSERAATPLLVPGVASDGSQRPGENPDHRRNLDERTARVVLFLV